MPVPTKEELLNYLKKHSEISKKRTFTAIADNFGINIHTVSDIVKDMLRKKLVKIEETGSAKVVRVAKGA